MVKVEDLRVGSLVRLASGSPKMTVVSVVQDEDPKIWLVYVVWYSEARGIEQAKFLPNLLVYPRSTAPEEQPA